MRILTIIPISRGISKDTLTYFAKESVPIGSVVSIPIRNKKGVGIVIEDTEAETLKTELKSLSYSIKKIEKIESRDFLSPAFIETTKKIADWNAAPLGSTLAALIPKKVLDAQPELSFVQPEKAKNVFFETLLLQSDDEERYATYKSMIREEFAKGRSIIFILPSTEDLLNSRSLLEKGIESYTHVIHSGLSTKDFLSTWKKVSEETHPILVITTGSYLTLPIQNLGSIILEKESSRGYKMQTRPFIDIRHAAEVFAKENGIKLILGDNFLRIETLWELKAQKKTSYSELSPLKFRSLSAAHTEIINMRLPQDQKTKEFSILGDKLKNTIARSIENNEHVFLFCGRKGLSPSTVCSDCGTVVVCKNCSAPVVLYRKKEMTAQSKNNLFVCHHCGERRDASEVCIHCKGWRLNPLGIGTEKVAEEIRTIFPNAKIAIMDKDNVTTHKQATKLRDIFYDSPGSILIGTELALPYLNVKIENVAVVSMDSYFAIPDFKINEKIVHILLDLKALTTQSFLIQTRQDNTRLFEYVLKGNLIDFYRDEVEERKAIGYPPFTTYVKITLQGNKIAIKKEMAQIKEYLMPYELNLFDAWNPGSEKGYTVHGLITLPYGTWIDDVLLSKLRGLPLECTIKIDPITLL